MSARTFLDKITPVILTFNEEPNIARTLGQLAFARDIVVVDSFSTDRTAEIVRAHPRTRLFQRVFDTHSRQWNFAVSETAIATPWILALDADYFVPDAAVAELRRIDPRSAVDGYTASFRYCVWGKPLRGTLYPPVTVLYRRDKGSYFQDGHTHRLRLDGRSQPLAEAFLHDDRKPLSHWLASQDRYMSLEADKILSQPLWQLTPPDRIRRVPLITPFLVFLYCYIVKRGVLDGHAGLYYALQRMLSEALLALRVLERRMNKFS